ncbi:hypothetical protein FHG87_015989, partial [Trinorchestia longiramus]
KKYAADDSQRLKESDSSAPSSPQNPTESNDDEEPLTSVSSEVKQSMSSSLLPSTLTVVTTQTSRLVVRNAPTLAVNKLNMENCNNSDDYSTPPLTRNHLDNASESESVLSVPTPNLPGSIKLQHPINLFQYDPLQVSGVPVNGTEDQSTGMPCSPTAVLQNSQNMSAEACRRGQTCSHLGSRCHSAMGHRGSNQGIDPLHHHVGDLSSGCRPSSVTAEAIASKNQVLLPDASYLNPYRSHSADYLHIPKPTPRIAHNNCYDDNKPPYQNVP